METAQWRAGRAMQFYPKADAVDAPSGALADAPDADVVLEACRRSGIEIVSVEPVHPGGTFHALFRGVDCRGHSVVVKCGLTESTRASLAIEAELSDVLAGADVPHARVLSADVTSGYAPFPFMIMSALDGEPLTTFDGDDARLSRVFGPYAFALRQTHSVQGNGFGLLSGVESSFPQAASMQWWGYVRSRLGDHCSILVAGGVITEWERDSILSVFEQVPKELASGLAPRLLHGDCGMHNAVYDGRAVALIDWEDAVLGDPLFEVAGWATFQPRRRWDAFFRSYFGHDWIPGPLFWIYFLRIALAKQVVRLRFGYQDRPGRTPAVERIFTALDHLVP
ncbi:aminoglycoside phosphotransferase family protein [Isoptericola sp. b441]|uniref:Aminoglycoside phosphotransferase family protein n=1 Tax=Actinotalea lenta TaxID=3064654 RepID=A0ABT9DDM2_9CELL|nr:aminoglycoside phosphotransferase family protein [Isoptericola sp. b441]MDO8108504.1 aminoglycoside phosphotransferase family protein [Isoptericola sp. b441]